MSEAVIDEATRRRLDGINLFLTAVFGEGTRLSTFLRSEFDTETLNPLKFDLLQPFLASLVTTWNRYLEEVLPAKHARVLYRRYGFDGGSIPTLAALGSELGVSRERIRQLQKNGIRRMQGRQRRETLRQIVVTSARVTLSRA